MRGGLYVLVVPFVFRISDSKKSRGNGCRKKRRNGKGKRKGTSLMRQEKEEDKEEGPWMVG